MTPIIEVHNLSKLYKIGQKQRYLSLRDSVTDLFKKKGQNTVDADFWALNDISFDVQAGESIGIIGRNGAGKSTLLKILSRITPPTKGKAILRGRMASLLEVGTGFHPELTGRENVYFNASILGLRKAEVVKKFDEIVAFSGVEQFIDTPLKHYSSGMQLRLAFAVAAHLEPEILVIDEVLAVGDAEFQKKCLGKMDEVSKSGRTVLFVSHNMTALKNICQRGILIQNGQLILDDKVETVVNKYLYDANTLGGGRLPVKVDYTLTLIEFDLTFEEQYVLFSCTFSFAEKPMIRDLCLLVFDQNGIRVAIVDMRLQLKSFQFEGNKAILTIQMAPWQMVEGAYQLGLYIVTAHGFKILYQLIDIHVPSVFLNSDILPYPAEHRGFVEIKVI